MKFCVYAKDGNHQNIVDVESIEAINVEDAAEKFAEGRDLSYIQIPKEFIGGEEEYYDDFGGVQPAEDVDVLYDPKKVDFPDILASIQDKGPSVRDWWYLVVQGDETGSTCEQIAEKITFSKMHLDVTYQAPDGSRVGFKNFGTAIRYAKEVGGGMIIDDETNEVLYDYEEEYYPDWAEVR